jgi:hypothetical protein
MRIIIKPLITQTPLSSFLDQSLPNYSTYLFKLWRAAIFWRAFQMRYEKLGGKEKKMGRRKCGFVCKIDF